MQLHFLRCNEWADFHAKASGPLPDAFGAFVKRVEGRARTPLGCAVGDAERDRGFTGPGRTDEQRAGASPQSAAKQRVELRRTARNDLYRCGAGRLGGNQAWKDFQPAGAYREIVIAATKLYSRILVTRRRRRSAPYSSANSSRVTTPWAML